MTLRVFQRELNYVLREKRFSSLSRWAPDPQIAQYDVSMASDAGPITFVATRCCFQPKIPYPVIFTYLLSFSETGELVSEQSFLRKSKIYIYFLHLNISYIYLSIILGLALLRRNISNTDQIIHWKRKFQLNSTWALNMARELNFQMSWYVAIAMFILSIPGLTLTSDFSENPEMCFRFPSNFAI